MTNFLDNIISTGVVLLSLIIPLFFLPITSDFYDFNKQALLYVVLGILLVAWGLKSIKSKSLKLHTTPFDLPVLLFLLANLVSTFIQPVNKTMAFFETNSIGLIVTLTFLYFLVTNNFNESHVPKVVSALLIAGSLISIVAISQLVGLTQNLLPNSLFWLQLRSWTPTGHLLYSVTFLILLLPLAFTKIYPTFKSSANKKIKSIIFGWILSLLIISGLGVLSFQLLLNKPLLLPAQTGWEIAVNTFKASPLFGIGTNNFLSAFTMHKPLAFNQSDFWTIRFNTSSNLYFEILTTLGILGIGSLLFLLSRIVWVIRKDVRVLFSWSKYKTPLIFSILAFFGISVLAPAGLTTLFVLYLLSACLAIYQKGKSREVHLSVLPWAITSILTLAVGFSLFRAVRNYQAELNFKKSIDALFQNQESQAYTFQGKAIDYNPYQPIFRASYSKTSLTIANNLTQKEELNDQDRQNISILIQQAIKEAKVAISLDPQNVIYWENIALVYRSLINSVQEADSWTVSAYQQAITLDPFNPNLRLSLGRVYYGLGEQDDAIDLFQQAIALKPDFTNGYYNLALSLKENGDLENAAAALEKVKSLVPENSQDWKKANNELEALTNKKTAEKTTKQTPAVSLEKTETLDPPPPLPVGINPPLTLPASSAPEIGPTKVPAATPTPSTPASNL
ncbi:MAG: tetratricopeptide repeat protein [bacterium]|nr:tetratricopeptide repeat protein [bacterium]